VKSEIDIPRVLGLPDRTFERTLNARLRAVALTVGHTFCSDDRTTFETVVNDGRFLSGD
jgi:hypothetical protein